MNHKVVELTREQEQLQISLDTSINDRDSLLQETESARRSNQMYENNVMELTNQLTILVREKEAVDENIRQLQREMVVKEKEGEELQKRLESMERAAEGQSSFVEEREVRLIGGRLKWG